ncbi:hypothetical protein SAMN02745121_04374 [Nannocystis exedens]|uniref:Uncharacterized protein n=1 Tax=Nannocystis exedens TaxID=54 RepID=A0A1I2ATR3_9BACT|nr:hypothetical protein NAEX_07360 [Nannocystis exedens]SFE47361.1 hypothetical protein SAMN02745121_04374 [Nannocystis exedens]
MRQPPPLISSSTTLGASQVRRASPARQAISLEVGPGLQGINPAADPTVEMPSRSETHVQSRPRAVRDGIPWMNPPGEFVGVIRGVVEVTGRRDTGP